MPLVDDSQEKVQAFPIGKGLTATSPYTVDNTQDKVVEFLTSASTTITFSDATTKVFTPLAGSRYSIPSYVTTITTTADFNIG